MVDQNFELGEYADIIVGPYTRALREFYQAIGFNVIQETKQALRMTDGSISIILGDFGNDEYGVIYYTTDFDRKLGYLRNKAIRYQVIPKTDKNSTRCIRIRNRQHLNFLLMEKELELACAPSLVMMEEERIDHMTVFPNQMCGIFGELSVGVEYLVPAIKEWERLGYELILQDDTDYPWAILRNNLNIIGLHQNNTYPKQVLSYFARDMEQLLEGLKKNPNLKLTPYGNQQAVTRAGVLTAPNGLRINLFSL